jgi:1,2-diacylglycerol 3-beta-glucosyltransferase
MPELVSGAAALITAPFALLVTLPTAYLAFLAAVTLLARRPRPLASAAGAVRFAILVPAHDEEILIHRTVIGLLGLAYPADRFSVHIVADNCSDATAAIARTAGACVHERTDPDRRGKGAALNWLAREVLRETPDVDAFVIVDADSALSPDFLAVVERDFAAGARVVQPLSLVAVSEDSPLVRIRELKFILCCHLRPLAYKVLGGSSALVNGTCIAAPLHERYPWSETSLVEDAELFLRLVRDGHHITLAPGATVRSVMPTTFGQGRTQGLRWEAGRFELARTAAGLAWLGLRRRDRNAFLAGVGVLIPPIAMLAPAAALGVGLGVLGGAPVLTSLGLASCLCLAWLTVRCAALGGMSARSLARVFVWAPAYAAWQLWLIARVAAGAGRGDWARTTRATTPTD